LNSKARRTDTGDLHIEKVAQEIVDSAFRVHSVPGPGLLECVYEQCPTHELSKRSLRFDLQKEIPVRYEAVHINCVLRLAMLVED
jgi:GxxExxY protein